MSKLDNDSEYFSDDELECISNFKDAWQNYTGEYDENWASVRPHLEGIQSILHRALIEAGLKSCGDEERSRDVKKRGKDRRDVLANTNVMTPFHPEELYGSAHTGFQDFRLSVELSPNYGDSVHRKKGLIRWIVRLTPRGEVDGWGEKRKKIRQFAESEFDDDVTTRTAANHFVIIDFDEFAPEALSDPDEWFSNLVNSLETHHMEVRQFLDKNDGEFRKLLEGIGFRPKHDGRMAADGGGEV